MSQTDERKNDTKASVIILVVIGLFVAIVVTVMVVHHVQDEHQKREACEISYGIDGYGPADAKAACS